MENRPPGRSQQGSNSRSDHWASWRMRRNWAIALGAASSLLASSVSMRAAHADPPSSLRIVGQGAACPTATQVATVLERMLPRTKVTADTGPASPADVTVSDEGARFRVTVAGQERSFDDGAHQCAERARHAAVFIALVVDPPAIGELPSLPPSLPPPAPAPVPPVDAARSAERQTKRTQWDLALGGVMLIAPEGRRRETTTAQGIAAFVRGKRGFHLGFGAGVLRGALRFDVAEADAWWIPIDVAAGLTTRTGGWEFGAEIGPNASVLSIVGVNLKEARRQVRVEVGGRLSTWSRFWFTKQFGVYLSAEALVRPFPYVLDIDPRGGIGEMPALWLGASVGVAALLE
jgi:hypothetical protein